MISLPDRNRTQRVTTGVAVLAIHVVIGAGLLFALAGKGLPLARSNDRVTLIADVPLPPPPPHLSARPTPHRQTASAPAAPRAPILAPPPPPQIATPVALPAPPVGTEEGGGLGGSGTGTGAGGDGNGEGNGDGGDGWAPERIGGHIGDRDYPRAFTAAGISGTVSVRYRVGTDGRVTGCIVTRSSGHAELDALTCDLIERRFRFRPARDAQGRPVRSAIIEDHSWIIPSAAPGSAADKDDGERPD